MTPTAGDIPVPGNYNDTAAAELAIYRPSTGQFFIDNNGTLVTVTLATGTAGDIPVPGDYNNSYTVVAGQPVASRATEPAVYNPTTGVWDILKAGGVVTSLTFQPGDIPAPGDYAGTGSLQPVVYRPSAGKFYNSSGTIVAAPRASRATSPDRAPGLPRPVVQTTLTLAASTDTGIMGDNSTSGISAERPPLDHPHRLRPTRARP